MNQNYLQIKISNLCAFLLAMLLGVGGVMNNLWAQTTVLQHEGERSVFYGSDSFINAYNAAIDGDVITLSEGSFNPCVIGKSITIHGAGARQDSVAGSFATRFTNHVYIGSNPIIEGVSFGVVWLQDQSRPQFLKCNFVLVQPGNNYNTHCQTVCFTNCYILNLRLICNPNTTFASYIDNCHLVNCVVWNFLNFYGQDNIASNSIIRMTDNMSNFTSYNSIIIRDDGCKPTNTCTFYNCIGVKNGWPDLVFEYSLNSMVVEYDSITDVFPAFVGEDILNEPFILNEGIAVSFLGTEGTEVGIHGGYYPYSSRPGYMRVRHCTVADRTTDDGHLSVDIEVVTEE